MSSAKAIAGGDPQAAVSFLSQSNPNFRAFLQANRGKTPEQAYRDYGLDYQMVKPYL